jgi:hypothetical protein
MLQDETKARQLEEETGMSREELSQFVRRFDQAPKQPAGEGRELEVKPGRAETLEPRKVEGGPTSRISSRSERGANAVAQDTQAGNVQGIRARVPEQYLSRYEAYIRSMDRAGTRRPAPSRPAPGGGK